MSSKKSDKRGKPTTMKVGRFEYEPNFSLTREKNKKEKPSYYPTEEEEARWTQRMIANVLKERKEMEEAMKEMAGSKRKRRRHRRTRHKRHASHKKRTKHKIKRGTNKRHKRRIHTRKRRRSR